MTDTRPQIGTVHARDVADMRAALEEKRRLGWTVIQIVPLPEPDCGCALVAFIEKAETVALCADCGENPGDVVVFPGNRLCETCANRAEARAERRLEQAEARAEEPHFDPGPGPCPPGVDRCPLKAFDGSPFPWLGYVIDALRGILSITSGDRPATEDPLAEIGRRVLDTLAGLDELSPPKPRPACCSGCLEITGLPARAGPSQVCADCGARWERDAEGWYISPADRGPDGKALDRRERKD